MLGQESLAFRSATRSHPTIASRCSAIFFRTPIPPGNLEELVTGAVIKSILNDVGGIATNNAIGRYIGCHDRFTRYYCATANFDSRHNGGFIANPNIMANLCVTFIGKFTLFRHDLFPAIAKYLKWVCREARYSVVCAIHYELYVLCDGAESTYSQLIADKREMIKNVALKSRRTLGVIVVGVVTNDDIFRGDIVLQLSHLGKPLHGFFIFRTRAFRIPHHLSMTSSCWNMLSMSRISHSSMIFPSSKRLSTIP